MEGDRKYRQRGYMDTGTPAGPDGWDDRERPRGPRPPIDITGPRLPRLVEAVTASRCYNCASTLPPGHDFTIPCPKCKVALHCCKQCAYFDSSTRFQCLKPILVRIAAKDGANDCTFFRGRVTVAKDSAPPMGGPLTERIEATPKSPTDARLAFDALFKKPE